MYPSPLGSGESAQGFLDVRTDMEEKEEDEMLSVPCMARDIAREG